MDPFELNNVSAVERNATQVSDDFNREFKASNPELKFKINKYSDDQLPEEYIEFRKKHWTEPDRTFIVDVDGDYVLPEQKWIESGSNFINCIPEDKPSQDKVGLYRVDSLKPNSEFNAFFLITGGNARKPFYSGSGHLIADPEVAYDIAKVEATKGRDAAIGYEELRRDAHENNLSEVEMQNLKVIEGMKKKYPYAVFEEFSPNGKPYLVMGNVLLVNSMHSDRDKKISNERSQIKDSLRELGDKLSSGILQKKNLNLPVKKLEYALMNWCRPVPNNNETFRDVFSVRGIFPAFVDIDNPPYGDEKEAPNWFDFSQGDVENLSKILKLLNEHNRLLSVEHGRREITKDFWEKLDGEVSSPEDFVDLL